MDRILRFRPVILALGLAALPLLGVQPAAAEEAAKSGDLTEVQAHWGMLNKYCSECHNFEDWAGGIAFDVMSADNVHKDAETWEKAMRKLRGRLMPPPGQPRPDEAVLDQFVSAIENYIDATAVADGPHAGHVALHRLNRKEYANAIEDVLALDVDAKSMLPPDTSMDGFDNVANVLQVSPTFLDQYINAARQISMEAVGLSASEPQLKAFEAPSVATQDRHVAGLPLGTRGGFAVDNYFPTDGEYQFSVEIASQEGSVQRSYPTWWLASEHRFILTIDGEEKFTTKLGGPIDMEAVDLRQTPAITEIQNRFQDIKVHVPAGDHTIGVAFVQRSFAESDRIVDQLSPGEGEDNIPLVVRFKLLGPFDAAPVEETASRKKIFSCHPSEKAEQRACAADIMERLARQAYRRPVTHGELQTLMGFYDSGAAQAGFETGVQKSIMAMLASTKFLYRSEPAPENVAQGQSYELTDAELASRLSYFLWSRGPDDELLDLAAAKKLDDPKVLRAQVERMLADPKAKSLADNFAYQWLRIGDVDAIDPDPRLFPDFDADLRIAFKKELTLFVDSVLRSDQSVMRLLDADYTFVDERLARHYGIDDIRGTQFRKIKLDDERRWGLLGKGGLLMLTSYPNRTSPVLRGAYILENIMGTPPAAPPPNVETDLEDTKPGAVATTVRERLEVHRADPSCNMCHGVIDPLGLALENFNAIGQWREKDRWANSVIDAAGQLASGEPVNGPADVRAALLDRPDQFVQTITEKLMTYALGRTTEYEDMPTVRGIVHDSQKEGYTFASLVMGIVKSPQFQMNTLPVVEAAEDGQKQAALQ
jgi:hypothetical protein